jgi:hypothetical protein
MHIFRFGCHLIYLAASIYQLAANLEASIPTGSHFGSQCSNWRPLFFAYTIFILHIKQITQ